MTRLPDQTFKTSPLRDPMDKISQNEAFLVACDYSLLMLIEEHPDPLNPAGLAQIVGARRVLEILKTIGEPIKNQKQARPPGINYDQK